MTRQYILLALLECMTIIIYIQRTARGLIYTLSKNNMITTVPETASGWNAANKAII
jgi:hypothetical protein